MSLDPRRKTLGLMSQGALNSRASMGAGASRIGKPMKRMSMHSTATRSSVGRPSSSGMRRSSTYGSSGVRRKREDPRLKMHIRESIYPVINFLGNNPYGITYDKHLPKTFASSPSQQNVQEVFQFLYSMIDPSFPFKKFEDDVMLLLKGFLNYSENISKTSLSAVGTGHTWPKFAASLAWLVSLLSYLHKAETIRQRQEQEDADVGERFFMSHLEETYYQFMHDETDLDVLNDTWNSKLESQFQIKGTALHEHISRLETEIASSKHSMEELRSRQSPLITLEENKRAFLNDIQKFAILIKQLTEHKRKMEEKHVKYTAEVQVKKNELDTLTTERDSLQERIDSQEISAEDVMKMNEERASLEDSFKTQRSKKEAMKSQVWERETQLAKRMERAQDLLSQYNKLRAALNLSSDTILELGEDGQLSCGGSSGEGDMSSVLSTMQGLKDTLIQRTFASQEQLISTQERVDGAEESLGERQDSLAEVEGELSRLQSMCQSEKESTASALSQITSERVSVEKELGILQSTTAQSLEETEKRLSELRSQYESEERRCEEERETFNRTLFTTLDLLTQHKAHIQETLAEMESASASVRAVVSK